jgi:hypothetical protein
LNGRGEPGVASMAPGEFLLIGGALERLHGAEPVLLGAEPGSGIYLDCWHSLS